MIPQPRGKVLGGCSSVNAMVAIRGNDADYDRWSGQGASGWDASSVRDAFRRLESHRLGDTERHGGTGPVMVTAPAQPHQLSRAFVDAALACGLPANTDFNGATQIGAGLYDVTIGDGQRSSAVTYLRAMGDRPNLTIITDAMVGRLIIDNGVVSGVEYSVGDEQLTAVGHETILSAGAFGSPQLLMLSGIGPADHLREIGIDVRVASEQVGKNLQDHPRIDIGFRTAAPIELSPTTNYLEAGAFVSTGLLADDPDPDVQFHFAPLTGLNPAFAHEPQGFMLLVNCTRPFSRGHLELASALPTDAPLVTMNYLDDARDAATLRAGLALGLEIMDKLVAQGVVAERFSPSDDALRDPDAYLTAMVDGEFHPAGTCRMGDDEAAVVDSHLRVRGISGLRVADASVMPSLPSGNTNLPVIMIAERLAEIIVAEKAGA